MPPKEDDGGGSGPSIPELPLPNNPWPDIKKRAGDAGWIKFDPQAAIAVGQAISDLQWKLFSLWGNATAVSSMIDLSTPAISSGPELAKVFGKQGQEMYRILGAHHKILDDMLDSVVAAGKNMAKTEEGNVEDLLRQLDGITTPLQDTHYADGKAPGALTQREGDHGKYRKGWNYDEDGMPTTRRKAASDYESGFHVKDNRKQPDIKGTRNAGIGEVQNKPWATLYANRQYLEGGVVADMVADDAAEWEHIGKKIQEWSVEFGNKIVNHLNPAAGEKVWEGEGAQAIKTALNNYRLSLEPLATSAAQHHSLLEHVSQFLQDTHYWAPPYKTEDEDPTYWLTDRQQMFGETYVRGVNFTSKSIPNLVYPTDAFKDVPPIYDPRDTNKDGKIDDKEKIPGDTNNDGKLSEEEKQALAKTQAGGPGGPGPGPGGPGPARAKAGPGPGPGLTAEQKKAQANAADEQRKAAQFAEQQRKDAARRANEQEAYEKTQRAANERRQAEAEQRAKDAAAEQEAYQKQQRAQAAAKEATSAAQQAAQQGLQAAQQAVQEALQGGQKGATEALAAAQQAAQNALANGMPKVGDLASKLGGPGPGPGSLAKGLGLTEAAKLFPRAGAATAATAAGTGLGSLGRAGAAMQATPGSPGPAGAAGQGAGQGQQNYKRPAYLESDQHLDELLGEAPKVVRPVVEQ
ncbi:cell envelope integrity protein TolA [Nocardia sp. bgisy118]|uniref:cell envelope integrity protein TolA n=1 Tax=Nocardia sp. bgisy118 TaxID=3413786 RepID=UPI003F4A75ED